MIFAANRTYASQIKLAFGCFVCLSIWLGHWGSLQAQTKSDWIFEKNGHPAFKLRIEVLNPDGSRANGCSVQSRAFKTEVEATEKDGKFEIELCPAEFDPFYSLRIVAQSGDGNLMAHRLVFARELRSLARDGIQLHLEPSRQVEISVVHDSAPVPDANVQISSWGVSKAIKTDGNGVARFRLPQDAEVFKILAWTDDPLIGGLEPRSMPGAVSLSSEFRIEMDQCRKVNFRVVDNEGKPVANTPVDVRVRTHDPIHQSFPFEHLGRVSTNQQGRATFGWMPRKLKLRRFYAQPDVKYWQYEKKIEEIKPDEFEVTVSPAKEGMRKLVTGKIDLPENEPGGFLMEVNSFQGLEERRSDNLSCFVSKDGKYQVSVLKGSTYSVSINDVDWSSSFWDGILYDPEVDEPEMPSITFQKGIPVDVVVTQGRDRKPVGNLDIRFAIPHRFSWIENGEKRNGRKERRWSIRTDESGVARCKAGPGVLSISVYTPDWRTNASLEVTPGKTNRIELNRPTPGTQPINGKLTFAGDFDGSLENASVVAFAADGESNGQSKAKADASGAFQLELPGTKLVYFAQTADRKFSASGSVDCENGLSYKLHPNASYLGTVEDENGQPVRNGTLTIEASVGFSSRNHFLPSSFSVGSYEAKIDNEGKFAFKNCLPTNVALTCRFADSDGKVIHGDRIYLERMKHHLLG